ncbi:MAG: M43 family zinc metalloprotease [Phycisphaerales bacterium]
MRVWASAGVVGLLLSASVVGDPGYDGGECAQTLSAGEGAIARALMDAGMYDLLAGGREADSFIYVPLTFHVVRRSNGTGGLTQERLDQAIIDANIAYAPAGIAFCRPGPVDYIDSDNFYLNINTQLEIDQLRTTNVVPNTINIYFTEELFIGSSSLCGISAFTFSSVQGIVMRNSCTALPTNASTFPHEIGHYFDLYHTHETALGRECVNGSNCTTAGDLVCDTPADPTLTTSNVNTSCVYTGTSFGTCSGDGRYAPDPTNFMSYSRKECRDFFSPGQLTRARATIFNLRPELVHLLAGDTNGDGVVNFIDLNMVLSQFGQSGVGLQGDLTGDGVVNFADLNAVLSTFGAVSCS